MLYDRDRRKFSDQIMTNPVTITRQLQENISTRPHIAISEWISLRKLYNVDMLNRVLQKSPHGNMCAHKHTQKKVGNRLNFIKTILHRTWNKSSGVMSLFFGIYNNDSRSRHSASQAEWGISWGLRSRYCTHQKLGLLCARNIYRTLNWIPLSKLIRHLINMAAFKFWKNMHYLFLTIIFVKIDLRTNYCSRIITVAGTVKKLLLIGLTRISRNLVIFPGQQSAQS